MQPPSSFPGSTHSPAPKPPVSDPSTLYPTPKSSWAPPPPVTPPAPEIGLKPGQSDKPIAVLEVLSVRGVEYGMMTIVLWIGAITLTWIALNMFNGSRGFNYIVIPAAALIVCVPVFGFFFLRLKKAELADPSTRFDASKRRWSQVTQIFTYTVVITNLMYFVYVILQQTSGSKGTSIGKAAVNLIVVLVIAGGILAYYWHDEHRLLK